MTDAKNRPVDKSKIVIPEGTMEDFKRPNHYDFMDSSELKKAKFTGLRHNSITDSAEIWIEGEIRKIVTFAEVALDPLAINKAYEEVFCLEEVLPDNYELRKLKGDL